MFGSAERPENGSSYDDALDRAYRALAHRDRRRLLGLLDDEHSPRTVNSLAEAARLDQPIASQHLKVLRDAGLVSVVADGNRRLYSVDFARLQEFRNHLDAFWAGRLLDLKDVAERDRGRP